MKVLVIGGRGFIGKALVQLLNQSGHQVVSTTRKEHPTGDFIHWNPQTQEFPSYAACEYDAFVSLAGEPVFPSRWSQKKRQAIRQSRVQLNEKVLLALQERHRRKAEPPVWISASATGYYGDTGDKKTDESSPAANSFLAKICEDWERPVLQADTARIARGCCLRVGLPLEASGGALSYMLPVFRAGLGGRIASGEQWMPWISLRDLTRAFQFLLESPHHGSFNAVAPTPVRNKDFTKSLAKTLKRPALLPVPAIALKCMFGKASCLLLDSQRILPSRLQQTGFQFQDIDIETTFQYLLVSNTNLKY